jgi:UDP-N-acetylglucosamine--N-acetylmuramyl-(pentapeptide) pyrophosphoryl-undecaprenol N-acetylglucosamine transferase
VVPAIAIGEAIRRRNSDSVILLVGSNRGIEADLAPKAGFELIELDVVGFPRGLGLGMIGAGWRLLRGVQRLRGIIDEFNPDVVVGTGGYVSVAAILAARLKGKPTLLQEQNSVPGRANRLLARLADEVHIHFTEARRHFKDRGKLRLSGNPVRIRIPEGRALKTLQKYRLYPDRKTVAVLGGSQGARSLNRAFCDMLPHFRNDRSVQFIIQTGKHDYRNVLDSVRNSGARVVVKSFINRMEDVYEVANLVVARAGAMTLAEIAACGLPSILVPYPHATGDHQTANAHALADKEAAVMIPDRELTGERLAETIRGLLEGDMKLRIMGANAYALSRPSAAKHIAEAVERLAGASPEALLNLPEDIDVAIEEAS